jgi:hypothetical protein
MATDESQTFTPLTTELAGMHRAMCEQQILGLLRALTDVTGLDLRAVTVHTLAAPRTDRDGPQVIPVAVRIDLTV